MPLRNIQFSSGWVCCALAVVIVLAAGTAGATELFENTIRPVLADNCYECHGTDQADGDLRIHNKADFLRGGARGALLSERPEDAGLLARVLQNSAPFDHPRVALMPVELSRLLDWIESGAPWPESKGPVSSSTMDELIAEARQSHWAFQPVKNPAVPESPATDWARSPIDRFVHTRLQDAELTPGPIADPRTVLRRIYFDLIGLPPTPEALNTFEQDPSLDAVERAVDGLLASPQYGERWGRYWLDIARYSDTKGFDSQTEQYFEFPHTYRDYVIQAFNEDLPYDLFLLHQIAADQLDLGDDPSPLAGMGFITLGRQFQGDKNLILDDQIDVVMRGTQALTVSCARCHDHKYDPIPNEDYYSLYGVFRSSYIPEEFPLIEKPDASAPAYQAYKEELDKLEGAMDRLIAKLHADELRSARSKAGDYVQAAYAARNFTEAGEINSLAKERGLKAPLLKKWHKHLTALKDQSDPVFGLWWAYAQLPPDAFDAEAGKVLELHGSGAAAAVSALFAESAPASMQDVNTRYGDILRAVDQEWKDHLTVHAQRSEMLEHAPPLPTKLPDANREVVRQVLYGTSSPARILPEEVAGLSEGEAKTKIAARKAAILKHVNTHPARPDRAMALADTSTPFDPYVFRRGNADSRGPDVPRQFLDVLTRGERKPFEHGSGRLELAQAIANKDNPLTARVMVNRVWMYHFGKPLVSTPSDFGLRGATPSHPDLLDYLAWHFMEDGWSVKRLHKRIMLSSTYLQASQDTLEGLEKDPENMWLWRQNRRRLDFEAMRDSMLAASGTLDSTMGGHSVRITDKPFSTRRTVYAEIDRQNLPAVFSTFDFATPNVHSARRFETTVPQQSLYLMNNPFIAEQARYMANEPKRMELPSTQERIRSFYQDLFLREPGAREIALGTAFVESQPTERPTNDGPKDEERWQYGYGIVNESVEAVENFAKLPHWTGEAYQGDANWPDGHLGSAMLDRRGGQPGGPEHAVVRRWVSPVTSTISLVGELYHYSPVGDGIKAYAVSSSQGILWAGEVQDGMIASLFTDIPVKKGDTVDLVVACKGDDKEDKFRWHPRLYLSADDAAQFPKQDWLTRFDFAAPPPAPPEPLTPWEQYAQVLLMSNEFMFVD
jgi:hypothetical protein